MCLRWKYADEKRHNSCFQGVHNVKGKGKYKTINYTDVKCCEGDMTDEKW